jgi:hypothetical protein
VTRSMKRERTKPQGEPMHARSLVRQARAPENHRSDVMPESRDITSFYSPESWLDRIHLGFPRANYW